MGKIIGAILGFIQLIAALITIFLFIGQVKEAGFTGNLFSDSKLTMPIFNFTYQEAGIISLVLIALGIVFVFIHTDIYRRSMSLLFSMANRRPEDGPPPAFFGLILARYPIAYIWAKAFWPIQNGQSLSMYLGSTVMVATGAIFIIEIIACITYVSIMAHEYE